MVQTSFRTDDRGTTSDCRLLISSICAAHPAMNLANLAESAEVLSHVVLLVFRG